MVDGSKSEKNNHNLVVGARIKHIRDTKSLSMEEFGKLFDPPASKGVVSNWENGYNLPNQERLKRIAELGNITVEELLHGTPVERMVNSTLEKAQNFTLTEKYMYAIEMLKEFTSMNKYLNNIYEESDNEKHKENIKVAIERQKDIVGAFFNTLLTTEEREQFEEFFINRK
ncbi:helix-turn-helix domain-containing protein [Aerococcaceae bacterium WGS1372]